MNFLRKLFWKLGLVELVWLLGSKSEDFPYEFGNYLRIKRKYKDGRCYAWVYKSIGSGVFLVDDGTTVGRSYIKGCKPYEG